MFTGIVTDVGRIERVEDRGDLRARIVSAYAPETITLGASIACDGVCLTVVDRGPAPGGAWFEVDVSAVSVSKTNIRRARTAWAYSSASRQARSRSRKRCAPFAASKTESGPKVGYLSSRACSESVVRPTDPSLCSG